MLEIDPGTVQLTLQLAVCGADALGVEPGDISAELAGSNMKKFANVEWTGWAGTKFRDTFRRR